MVSRVMPEDMLATHSNCQWMAQPGGCNCLVSALLLLSSFFRDIPSVHAVTGGGPGLSGGL